MLHLRSADRLAHCRTACLWRINVADSEVDGRIIGRALLFIKDISYDIRDVPKVAIQKVGRKALVNAMNRLERVLATTTLSVIVAGCGHGESPSEPTGTESISLTNVAPPDGTKLSPGASVTVTATVSTQESCSTGGTITMTIVDQTGKALSPAVSKFTSDGRHATSFSAVFTVPKTGTSHVDVKFSLYANDLCCFLCIFQPTAGVTYPVG